MKSSCEELVEEEEGRRGEEEGGEKREEKMEREKGFQRSCLIS